MNRSIDYFDLPYPLVNVYIANWKITKFSICKSTISIAIFNSKLLNYQAGLMEK